ncbi:MAG: hypothetical protein KC589_07765 [Nanoarchaeota archaeon]|nr:hypothetical protein [Nanoarchaeota archaeon]
MVEKLSKNIFKYFCNIYETKNSILVLFFIIISAGTYIIKWIYDHNKIFEAVDKDAPDSMRGLIVTFVIPIIWLIFITPLNFIFDNSIVIYWINIIIWYIIIVLSLKYIYDFCSTFAMITQTKTLVWYLFLYSGYFGLVLLLFDFYVLWFLPFVTIFTIAFMQALLNKVVGDFRQRKDKVTFNSMTRANGL